MQETQVRFFGRRSPGGEQGNPLQYSCLEIPRTEELGRLQPMGLHELETIEQLNIHTHCTLRSFSFFPSFTPSIHLSLSVQSHGLFYYDGWNPLLSLFISVLTLSRFGQWDHPQASPFFLCVCLFSLLLSFSYSYRSLSSFFQHNKGCIPCPNPEIIHFSRKPFFFTRMVFRNQNLDA